MKKKTILIFGLLVLMTGVGLYAKKMLALIVPTDLYAESYWGGTCVRLVNSGYSLSARWQ